MIEIQKHSTYIRDIKEKREREMNEKTTEYEYPKWMSDI